MYKRQLSFPAASPYVLVPQGAYDVRLVAAGAADCSAPTGSATDIPALSAANPVTLAVFGTPNASTPDTALRIEGFVDDISATGSSAHVRLIDGSTRLANVELGALTPTFTPILSGVRFGASSAGNTMADANGYATIDPIAGETVVVREIGGGGAASSMATATGVNLGGGSIVTFVVIDDTVTAGGGGRIVECLDGAGTTASQVGCQDISP